MSGRRGTFAKIVIYAAAVVAIVVAVQQLTLIEGMVAHTRVYVGDIPVDILAPRNITSPAPAAVITHGFSASRQYMYPFAYTLARNGYVAAVFDLSGHGQNPAPFPYNWQDVHTDSSPLTSDLKAVIAYVKSLPQVDGTQLALIGHSMGSAIVTRYARDAEDIRATIAISEIFSDVLPAQPPNLLLLTGDWELNSLKSTAMDALEASGGGQVGVMNGDTASGTARKLVFVPYVEHMTIVYSPRTLRETVSWLDATFGRTSSLAVDIRLPWVALLFAGSFILFFPVVGVLIGWLFRHRAEQEPSPLEITGFLLITLIPSAGIPLLLSILPYRVLPLTTGDYVAASILLQGIVMLIALLATKSLDGSMLWRLVSLRSVLAAGLAFVYLALTFGVIAQTTLVNLVPAPRRATIIAAAFVMALPYFLSTEYMSRTGYPGYNRIFPVISKLALLGSLGLGALLGGPYVLLLFLPAIALILFGGGLLSRRLYAVTGHPGVSGLFMACIFAWLIGAIFPMT